MIVPSSLKTVFSCERPSMVVSGRMPWSTVCVSPFTWIGTISRSKRPSSVALAASCWERAPSSSSSERGISHFSEIISAERPCGIRLYFSMSCGE